MTLEKAEGPAAALLCPTCGVHDGANKIEPCGVKFRCVLRIGRKPMRTITYALALALGVAFATLAFAADVTAAKTKADCDKAGGMWDATTNTCAAKQ
jgi:hypothetical protein